MRADACPGQADMTPEGAMRLMVLLGGILRQTAVTTIEPRRLLARFIHARLPAGSIGLEALDDVARKPQRYRDLGQLFLRASFATASDKLGKHFSEWLARLKSSAVHSWIVRIGRDAALEAAPRRHADAMHGDTELLASYSTIFQYESLRITLASRNV